MLYTARGNRARGFTLTDDNNNTLGTIQYDNWFSRKARLMLYNSDVYAVVAAGFWMTSFDILHAEIKTGEIRMNLRGKIFLAFNGSNYVYQRKGFFGRQFTLYDEGGQQLAMIRVRFDWSKFGFVYEIEWDSGCRITDMPILMLAMIYATNQQYARSGGGY